MTEPAYLAARTVAPKVEAHFAQHAAGGAAPRRGRSRHAPDADTIEAIIDAAFWASLRREESYVPKISLAFLPADAATHPLMFERPLPLVPGALVKVAPAVERPGIHLGVWRDGQELSVWGTVRAIPPLCLVVEVAAPGLLVVKHHRGDEAAGKFVNVAVLEGDQIKIVDERASSLPDCPPLLTSLLGFDSPASWRQGSSVNVLVQLAVSMRAHGAWRAAAGRAGGQRGVAGVDRAADPVRGRAAVCAARGAEAPGARTRSTSGPGRTPSTAPSRWLPDLTAVDGATVLTNQYELLAFGAKITRRKGSPQVEQVTVTEPVEGNVAADRASRRSSAARATCPPRSSSTISATPWRSWHRRTAASPCLRGRRARRWSTRTGSRRCSCE